MLEESLNNPGPSIGSVVDHESPVYAGRQFAVAEMFSAGHLVFNLVVHVRLSGFVDADSLTHALGAVVSGQSALNGAWSPEGEWHPGANQPSTAISVRSYSAPGETADMQSMLARLTREELETPFALTEGPLYRFTTIGSADGATILLATFHQSTFDDHSVACFVDLLGDELSGSSPGVDSVATTPDMTPAEHERHLAWWRNALQTVPPFSQIWGDHAANGQKIHGFGRCRKPFQDPLRVAVRERAQACGVSVQDICLLAWSGVLLPYCESGSGFVVVSNRDPFNNIQCIGAREIRVPIPVTTPSVSSLGEHVRKFKTQLDACLAHRLPASEIAAHIGINRDPDQPAFSGVAFSVHPTEVFPHQRGDVELTILGSEFLHRDFEIRLTVPPGDRLDHVEIQYDRRLYDEPVVSCLLFRFLFILEQISTLDIELSPDSLAPAPNEEMHRILYQRNQTGLDIGEPRTLHQRFERQVDRIPQAVALRHLDSQVTFADLERQANAIAWLLLENGITNGEPVALAFQRSPELVSAMLGILKAGSPFISLDTAHPEKRLRHILDDSGVKVVLTNAENAGRLPAVGARLIRLDEDTTRLDALSHDRPDLAVSPDSAASIIYTSGSTGAPKGVIGTHGGLVNVCWWAFEHLQGEERHVNAIKTTPGFVDSIWEILGALGSGTESVIVPPAAGNDPEKLLAVLSKGGVTRMTLVPSLMKAMLDTDKRFADVIPALSLWIPSGEALPGDLCNRLRDELPDARIINAYGCSEAAAISTAYVSPGPESRAGVPIGVPVLNTEVYVLDQSQRPVPEGVPGELWIGGMGLALGYYGDSALSNEKFRRIDLSPTLQPRLYRSGDRVRWLACGELEYLGRYDRQVQIRGFRIDLAEIESALRAHDEIRDAIAITRRLGNDASALVAYVTTMRDTPPTQAELRSWCRDRLPGYMTPRAIMFLDVLPLNPNGKLDAARLPDIVVSDSHGSSLDDEGLQRTVELFADVLGASNVDPDDDFFDLGGHSLLAAELAREMSAVFGRTVEIAVIYERPTPRDLSGYIRSETGAESLVRLNRPAVTAEGIPIFCVFGLFLYRDLAEALADTNPVYGGYIDYEFQIFQSIVNNESNIPVPQVEALSQRYVELIRNAGGGKPMCLAGASFGGVVAMEVARRLRESGEDVVLVTLFDAPFPWSRFKSAREFLRDLGTTFLLKGGVIGKLLRQKFSAALQSSAFERGELRQLVFDQAMRRFVPRVYDGDVALYLAGDSEGYEKESLLADTKWREICTGRFTTETLSGGHIEILQNPHVQPMARSIVSLLGHSASRHLPVDDHARSKSFSEMAS